MLQLGAVHPCCQGCQCYLSGAGKRLQAFDQPEHEVPCHPSDSMREQGFYFTGDGAKRGKDGYITITGRVDDVINVSGHRVGTAEVESALASHGACVEAAVVGYACRPGCCGVFVVIAVLVAVGSLGDYYLCLHADLEHVPCQTCGSVV